MNYDILIIGGGASGLAAACQVAGSGLSVALLERNPRVGKKLLTTGNGRCNLGNDYIDEEFFHGDYKAFADIINNFDTRSFFESMGLYCISDDEGRLYPRSNAAASVLDALRFKAEDKGVSFICNCKVERIVPHQHGFDVFSSLGRFFSRCVIISTGGLAAPSTGSDGFSFSIAEDLGHNVTKLHPALTRIKTDSSLVRILNGQRASCTAKLLCNGEVIRIQEGEVQFSDGFLSGICIFNLSRYARDSQKGMEISLDLAPDLSFPELSDMVSNILKTRKRYAAEDILSGLLPKRVGMAVISGITLDKGAAKKITAKIKNFCFPVLDVGKWHEAQVTAGGISASELLPNLCSKHHKNMYFSGEAVNVDGDCGGYNLHWAWSSGATCALSAIKSLKI